MIKNIIFDFGQVIVKFDEEYMTSVYVEGEANVKAVKEIIFDRLYWDKLDTGAISDTEVKAEAAKRLPENLREAACRVYDNWYRNLPFAEGMPELINRLKSDGYRLFLLSNISIGFAENYKTVPELANILGLFDGLVFSGPLGITKPGKEIFEHILGKYGLKAEESLFVDDNKNNIKGAESVGINAYLFDGASEKLSDYLSLK